MKQQLEKELNWSLAGRVYNILPPEITTKAKRYLDEILSTHPVAKTKPTLTVAKYYEQYLKNGIS